MKGGIRKTELSDKLIQEIDEKANGNDLVNLKEEVKSQKSDLTSELEKTRLRNYMGV